MSSKAGEVHFQIKRKVVNPAGWLIAALKEDYATLESYEKPEELIPKVKKKEEIKRLPREEELKWIGQKDKG